MSLMVTRKDFLRTNLDHKEKEKLLHYIALKISAKGKIGFVTMQPRYWDLLEMLKVPEPTEPQAKQWYDKRMKQIKEVIKVLKPLKNELQYYSTKNPDR